MGSDLTIDLNLARDNPPASIKYMYVGNQNQLNLISIYYLLTGCKGRTRKYKPKVLHTARACEGCLENQGLVFPGMARAPS